MSFNVWGAGANEGKPIDETVAAIKAAGADIIGIQETRTEGDDCTADVCPPGGESRAKAIAEALGFHYYDQTAENDANWSNAILSRFPIGTATANDTGVPIDVNGRTVYAFNLHLDDSPYQPYQLVGIEYGAVPLPQDRRGGDQGGRGDARRRRSRCSARTSRRRTAPTPPSSSATSTSPRTATGPRPRPRPAAIRSRSPTRRRSRSRTKASSTPSASSSPTRWRSPAFTWTPTTEPTDPEDHHDRIDFVFARAPKLEVLSAGIVGEKAPEADIVVTPWPADHRAVVATVKF